MKMNNKLLGKENFPVFEKYKGLVYLDNSATQQKPKRIPPRSKSQKGSSTLL